MQVCASYLGETISAEGTLRLMHWGGTAWTDITSLVDTAADRVCGQATTLSPFTLALAPPGYLGPPPAIATVTPNTGTTAGGTSITIGGSGFQAGATVTLGGIVVVPSSISATSIALLTPAHATGAVSLRVTNPDGQTTVVAAAFTYNLAPAITSVSPSVGPDTGNTLVTITGQNFVAGATVNFGTAAATQVTVVNATTITARTPVLPSTVAPAVVVDVTVTTANGTAVLPGGFTYNVLPRLSDGVSPGRSTCRRDARHASRLELRGRRDGDVRWHTCRRRELGQQQPHRGHDARARRRPGRRRRSDRGWHAYIDGAEFVLVRRAVRGRCARARRARQPGLGWESIVAGRECPARSAE